MAAAINDLMIILRQKYHWAQPQLQNLFAEALTQMEKQLPKHKYIVFVIKQLYIHIWKSKLVNKRSRSLPRYGYDNENTRRWSILETQSITGLVKPGQRLPPSISTPSPQLPNKFGNFLLGELSFHSLRHCPTQIPNIN